MMFPDDASGRYIITESGCELAARLAHAQHDISPALEDADCQLVQPQPTRAVGNAESYDVVFIEDIPLMQRLGRKKLAHLYFLSAVLSVV